MKKTTTRLATVAVVIVMGAFAIALAQHDSRQHGREPELENAFANQQATPLTVDGDWSAQLPQLPGTDAAEPALVAQLASTPRGFPAYDGIEEGSEEGSVDAQQRWRLEPPAQSSGDFSALPDSDTAVASTDLYVRDTGPTEADNPLRATAQALFDSETESSFTHGMEYPDSQVVTASAEEPGAPPQLPPAWLGDNSNADLPKSSAGATASELPQLPQQGLPSLPSFPLGSAGTASPANTDQIRQNLGVNQPANGAAGTPSAGNVSLGVPQLPTMLDQALPATTPASSRGSANYSLSDTQRGAMAPTDLAAPPGTGNAAGAPMTGGAAAYSNQSLVGTGGVPAQPTSNASSIGARGTAASYEGANPTGFGRPGDNPRSPAARTAGPTPAITTGLGGLVSDLPANRYLDGSQNPILLIQKRAPDEIQVGKPATFVITVRNAGNSTAHEVTVLDSVPRGMRFADANPPISPSADGILAWSLGEMAAGDERTLSLQLVPEVEGEVGSTAVVTFATQASVRTVATQPRVEVRLEASPEVLIGGVHQVQVTLANTGTGIARNVRLEADIPPQLRHESGEALLDAAIGDLRPNESRRIQLTTSAVEMGMAECVVRAVDEDGVQAEQRASLEIKSPQLVAGIEGPARRYLERQATYRIAVQNTGTAPATNLDFVIHLPAGLKFISTDIPQSTYEPKNNTVTLGLFELAPGKTAPISLTVLPVEIGPQAIKLNATADLGVTTEAIGQVQVDGLAELAFTIGQDNGTVEVGASTTYSVQLSNVGNQTDRQVQLVAQLPAGAELLGVDAPVEYRVEGSSIMFSPLAELKSKAQHTYRFQVRHNTAGNQVVRTQLTSANWPVPVVKEEGTLVYNDK